MKKKRLKSHSHEGWHPRSTSPAGAGSGVSQVNLLLVRENDRGLLFLEDHRDKAEAIKAKVRVKAIRAKARVGARARQGRCFVSSASSLDI